MVQADYVTIAIRALTTDGSANPSTNAAATGCNKFIMDLSARAMYILTCPSGYGWEGRMSLRFKPADRRYFIGGSDARIIMGDDEAALLRLWREKRGEVEPEDLSGNLIVQLGLATEELNRALVRTQYRAGVDRGPTAGAASRQCAGWPRPSTAWSRPPGRCSRPSSCCRGRSPKRRRPKSTWRSCSTTCGSPTPSWRCSRSSPVAANGSRSPSRPIRSTSTCC